MDRFRLLLASSLGLFVGAATVLACQPAPVQQNGINARPDKPDDDDDNKGDDDDFQAGDDDDVVTTKPADDPLPDGGKPPGRIYAHTASSLYLFDPLVQTLKKVGDFNFDTFGAELERMLDIALDSDSVIIYGTTDHGFVKIDPITAQMTYVKKNAVKFQFPNALSFVPTGTVDPTKEALVGYLQKPGTFGPTTYVRVDIATGNVTELGDLNPLNAALTWRSAGDIISTFRGGNKAYLTVQLFNVDGGAIDADPGTDSLAEVDPKTGKLVKIIGDIGQADFYGLGQWAGTSYGFNAIGNIVQINMDTGAGKTLLTLKEDGGVTGSWFGAGMTTAAPTAP